MPDTQPTIEARLQILESTLAAHLRSHQDTEDAEAERADIQAGITVRRERRRYHDERLAEEQRRDADYRIGELEDKVREAERRR